MERPDSYVIIVSSHNLAELRACLHYQPRDLWLVVTAAMRREGIRLGKVLAEQLKDTCIRVLGQEGHHALHGEFVEESAAWCRQHLVPALEAARPDPRAILNMTGGTKSLAFALAQAYPWSELHYQPFQADTARLERLKPDPAGGLLTLAQVDLSHVELDPVQIARLYMDSVSKHSRNPVADREGSLTLALDRLHAQQQPDNPDMPWNRLTRVLETVWLSDVPLSGMTASVTIPWSDLHTGPAEMADFLLALSALAPPGQVRWDPAGLTVPTVRNRKAASWRKWVCGGWLEQLVETWLLEGGVNPRNLAANMQLRIGHSAGREADMLLLHRNALHVLELKADLPSNGSVGDFEMQLSSLGNTLGLTRKVLILGPAVRLRHTPEQWRSFELRCKDNRVTLIELNGPESLTALLPPVATPHPSGKAAQACEPDGLPPAQAITLTHRTGGTS